MEHDNALIRKWARTSHNLSVGLLCVFILALSLLGVCYWAVDRVVQEEKDKISFHFSRLMGDIREHQDFLVRIAQQSDAVTQKKDQEVVPLQRRLLTSESGLDIYEGREFSFAMPFTLATDGRVPLDDEAQGPFALGIMLANFYGSYWSTSAYPAPQLLVFNLTGDTSLAVPAIDTSALRGGVRDTYPELTARVLARVRERPPGSDELRVHWARADYYQGASQELLGYISLQLAAPLWWGAGVRHAIVVASLLDLGRINDFEQLLDRPGFSTLSLFSPEGGHLLGPPVPDGLVDGLSFTGGGVLLRLRSAADGGWTAVYGIDYPRFFRYAQWPLLGSLLLLMGGLLAGWFGLQWYARRVVEPAREAHRQLAESDAFSRTIIHTAPVALAVLSHDGREVVMQNRLASEWLGEADQILALTAGWNLFEAAGWPPGDVCTIADGRYLQAAFAATRYNGADTLLCVFNDVSLHREAEAILVGAKRAADSASEAKTLFLASMSHEIRTPLYGVLGTLELLGLTDLDARQRGYLQTIQDSSAVLLQLISDVLDVSKIEAGQMALNFVDFSPLELLEEVLRNYAASAAARHLQFYGCIDAGLPQQLHGDAARIRQILNNLVSNALKFTDVGRVVLRLKVLSRDNGQVRLQWQVADTGIGIPQGKQPRLFEAFYQVNGQQRTSGTGLGLSICWHLARLMGGSMQVVSEEGLGSSFSLVVDLAQGSDGAPPPIAAPAQQEPVYLRCSIRELADSVEVWLARWGYCVLSGEPPEEAAESAILLELLPVHASPFTWRGPRVRAVVEAGSQPQWREDGWYVSLYSMAGIVQALAQARGGNVREALAQDVGRHPGQLGLRVLVAEDNPVNQRLLREQLEELGCHVCLAGDGREALLLFDSQLFDVLLSDVNMPNMNGYELTRTLRTRGEGIPIVGVTANAMREEGERCRAVGMNAWLVKPISLQTLHDTLSGLAGDVTSVVEAGPWGAGPVDEPGAEPLQIPGNMRELFLQTMDNDLGTAEKACGQGDAQALRQCVHRMAGALAVARARSLVEDCREVEQGLLDGRLLPAAPQVRQLLAHIAAALRGVREPG
ncbi:response regulator [Pseudomonas sp. JH-2]|uniref:hybrid sensor histidine kinase/response regulator n=1 Tax=Pseudomonas sp. JH-2 TaxID=3114998 RepID=UPI002E2611A0|nr:response regulator [Pseudomonas sp. JH-2]